MYKFRIINLLYAYNTKRNNIQKLKSYRKWSLLYQNGLRIRYCKKKIKHINIEVERYDLTN